MTVERRAFLVRAGSTLAALCARPAGAAASGGDPSPPDEHQSAVLVDLTQCVGCRLCEYACSKANGLPAGPLESYDDQSVFSRHRRPAPDALTVVNAWPRPTGGDSGPATRVAATATATSHPAAVYAKVNCVHCLHPACVSACIVGALQRRPDGAVTYDAWKCIGCRYCMVACPFGLPAYEYEDAFTPRVMKCQFCAPLIAKGEPPACVAACPRQAMQFGPRSRLVEFAHQRIAAEPGRYVDHVYGEHEVGGTAWMYVSPVPFAQAGFVTLPSTAPPALTEAIQHGVFKHWIAPVGWYALLALVMYVTGRRARVAVDSAVSAEGSPPGPTPGPRQHTAMTLPLPWRRARGHVAATACGDGDGHCCGGCGEPGGVRLQEYVAEAGRDACSDHEVRPAASTAIAEALPAPTPAALVRAEGPGSGDDDEPRHKPARHDAHGLSDDGVGGNGRARPQRPGRSGAHGHDHPVAMPVDHRLLTPGVWLLIALVVVGFGFMAYRFIFGLAATTNLDQHYPWGLWIAMDVGSGIALAGGGFVTATLVHIFHREHYHAVARSALLTALLGYTFYVPGLLADIGRWYNIWHPILPSMWQGNSVLFEVGICVMLYLNVQYAEMVPVVCERLMAQERLARFHGLIRLIHGRAEFVMPALLVLGVALSTFHQSSLGNLMVIAPHKLHALWWTPLSPLLFLLSAMMVGFPMVIFTILAASWSLNRKPEMHVLAPLAARFVPAFLCLYLCAKVGDMAVRGTWTYLLDGSAAGGLWLAEMLGGVVLPLALLLAPRVRRSPRWLAASTLLVILGVVLNRLNVFVLGYSPPFAEKAYFPSLTEFMVSMGLVAALMLAYRVAVTYLPILEPTEGARQT